MLRARLSIKNNGLLKGIPLAGTMTPVPREDPSLACRSPLDIHRPNA